MNKFYKTDNISIRTMDNLKKFQDCMNDLLQETSDKLYETFLEQQAPVEQSTLETDLQCKINDPTGEKTYIYNRKKMLTECLQNINVKTGNDLIEKLSDNEKSFDEIINTLQNIKKYMFTIGKYVATNRINDLVSNKPGYAHNSHTDPNLVDPWGIVIHKSLLYVVSNASNNVTCYDLFGNLLHVPFTVKDWHHNSASPTGICVNTSNGFAVSNGKHEKYAEILVCTKNGTIHGYNRELGHESYIVINQQLTGKVTMYTGLVVADGKMYQADFFNGNIDVFDRNYNRLDTKNTFVDADVSDPIPPDFVPYNIVNIGDYLYVLYARQSPLVKTRDIDGPGNGFISVFNFYGSFIKRFYSRGVLNSPWAMIPTPKSRGFPDGGFLVGNNGDGIINIFDADGKYCGPLLSACGKPALTKGLRGLTMYDSGFYEIYATSSSDPETSGHISSFVKDQIIQI